jgi:Ca2+-binding RTX toxin-like protein
MEENSFELDLGLIANPLVPTLGLEGLNGGAGDDTLCGAFGNDRLIGGDGADQIRGGSGQDILDGGADESAINAPDTITALAAEDHIQFTDGPAGNGANYAELSSFDPAAVDALFAASGVRYVAMARGGKGPRSSGGGGPRSNRRFAEKLLGSLSDKGFMSQSGAIGALRHSFYR